MMLITTVSEFGVGHPACTVGRATEFVENRLFLVEQRKERPNLYSFSRRSRSESSHGAWEVIEKAVRILTAAPFEEAMGWCW